MLKANEQVSEKNRLIVSDAIKKATNKDNFKTVYGYQIKNLFIMQLTKHYAIGFNQDEVVAVEIDKQGNLGGEALRFSKEDTIKFNLHGKLHMENAAGKIKLDVPGMVPSIMGTKQLSINQMDEMTELTQFVSSLKG